MSTITPQDMADASNGEDISPATGAQAPSMLSQTLAAPMPSEQSAGSPQEQDMDAATSGPQAPPVGGRLRAILGAIASVGSTALAGIPSQGRPSFAGGLGEGARAGQAAQATQQDVKFRTFQDSVRAANLHNQDLQKQQADADQQKAQQAAEDFQREAFENNGGSYNTHPNDGTAVVQTLQGQTQANGSASIAPGTHISANGKDILMPSDDPNSLAAQVKNFKSLQGILPGLPTLPTFDPASVKSTQDVANARTNLGQHLDIMQHLLQGYKVDGSPYSHQELQNLIPAYQAQIDSLTKSGNATPYQLGTLKNTLAILQANESNHQDAEDEAFDNQTTALTDRAKALGAVSTANKEALQDNAASDKPQKAQSTDWVPGVSADEKRKAELAENIAFNANEVAKIVMKRPDLFGAVAGRFTDAQQMMGNNDPDIAALGTHIHNMAMANSGVHGFRSQEGVESYEKQILNNFKNGPKAMAGALRASTGSVQTFVDNARPDTYKTHSKNGGAVTGMMQ